MRLLENNHSTHIHCKHLIMQQNPTQPYQTLLNEQSEKTSENKYLISSGSDWAISVRMLFIGIEVNQ